MLRVRAFIAVLMAGFRWPVRFWSGRTVSVAQAQTPLQSGRDLSATALNDRRGAGMRCRGFLGHPAVWMLG